jgi:hypothetical protein
MSFFIAGELAQAASTVTATAAEASKGRLIESRMMIPGLLSDVRPMSAERRPA